MLCVRAQSAEKADRLVAVRFFVAGETTLIAALLQAWSGKRAISAVFRAFSDQLANDDSRLAAKPQVRRTHLRKACELFRRRCANRGFVVSRVAICRDWRSPSSRASQASSLGCWLHHDRYGSVLRSLPSRCGVSQRRCKGWRFCSSLPQAWSQGFSAKASFPLWWSHQMDAIRESAGKGRVAYGHLSNERRITQAGA